MRRALAPDDLRMGRVAALGGRLRGEIDDDHFNRGVRSVRLQADWIEHRLLEQMFEATLRALVLIADDNDDG